MNRLDDPDRKLASTEIEQKPRRFEGPNGIDALGGVLICVRTK
jgi:hypothetical protein